MKFEPKRMMTNIGKTSPKANFFNESGTDSNKQKYSIVYKDSLSDLNYFPKLQKLRSMKVLAYLKEEVRSLENYEGLNQDTFHKQKIIDEEVLFLIQNIRNLTKVMKYNPKLKELNVRDMFTLTNKVIDCNDTIPHNIDNEFVMGIFDLTHEALLLETNDLNDSESEKEHGGFEIAEEDYDSEVDEAIKKSAIIKSSYGESSLKDDGPDEYTLRFKHARRKFRRLKLLMEDMRQEQMQYILNTLKVLFLFLQITRKVNIFGETNDQAKV